MRQAQVVSYFMQHYRSDTMPETLFIICRQPVVSYHAGFTRAKSKTENAPYGIFI